MEKEQQIKEILISLKDNPKKILELEKYNVSDVIHVAFKSELYDELMLTFQPVTIDGEVKICFDAFSSNILNVLEYACDTKEQAEQEASKEYEDIQERNNNLSEEEKEFLFISTTYEEILNSKIIIPKKIKEVFKKKLFMIDYEQISQMKIKNSHARQISEWNHPIESVEDVIMYSELPCLMACIDLFNKNIRTTMNDTNGVMEDRSVSSGVCTVWIDYSFLDDENKKIMEELISEGIAERFMDDNNTDTISIFVPCHNEQTVGEVSQQLQSITSRIKVQDILYGRGTLEEVYQKYLFYITNYPEFAEGCFDNGITVEGIIKFGQNLGDNLFYDEEEGLIWNSPKLFEKHKDFLMNYSNKNTLNSN